MIRDLRSPQSIHREEWLRYLQVKGGPDAGLAARMAEAERMLLQAAQIRGTYRVVPRGEAAAEGFSITKHLEGCSRVAVMAVTIGNGIDALIRRYEITSMPMAMIADTGASVLAGQAADLFEQAMIGEIREKMPEEDGPVFFTARFSPGYGDYPLRCQKDILNCVDAGRRIGLTLTSENMMIPCKSITALVGIADHPVTGRLATCEECVLRDKCTLRRQGEHC